MTRSKPRPGLSAGASRAAIIALAGLAASLAGAQPSRTMMERAWRQNAFDPDTFDEFADYDEYSMMGRARQGGEFEPKSELARQIMQQDYSRDPAAVLAARVKLASEARDLLLNPPAPEPQPAGESGDAQAPDQAPAPTDPALSGVGGDMSDTAAQLEMLMEMGGEIPPEMLQAMAGMGEFQPEFQPEDDPSLTPEEQKRKAAEREKARKDAEHFRLLVVAGRWADVGEFLASRFTDDESKGDAATIYSYLLMQLVGVDQALTPDELIAVADAAPVPLTDDHISSLGALIQAAAARGCDTGPLAARIHQGTRHFGGDDPANRKRAASLLVAAGMPVAAQEYLPPLAQAEAAQDTDLLNLYAVYFHALSDERTGEEQREAAREGWRLCTRVLSIETAGVEQRSKALGIILRLLDTMDPDAADEFLHALFATESEIGWLMLDKVNKAARNLRMQQAPPDARARALHRIKRVGRALIAGAGDSAPRWRTGLDMLTLTILEEAEMTRQGQQDPRFQPIPAEQLAEALPDAAWLATIDPGLAAKLEVMVAATDGGSGETDSVMAMIRPIIDTDPERAARLAGALIEAWPNYVGRGAPALDEYDPYGMMSGIYPSYAYGSYYNPYGYGGAEGAIPLTRARQRRSLDQLDAVLGDFESMGIDDLPAESLVTAFAASHSQAEVFAEDDIVAIFGPFDAMQPDTRRQLAEDMRARLGSQWRNPQAQQEAQTKRTDAQLVAEITRGYAVALELAAAGIAADPADWRSHILAGNLNFDRAEFLYGQNVDFETYTKGRDAAFTAYAEAARLYAHTLTSADASPTAEVYLRWFSSALGASDLGFLTRQDEPDLGQVDRVVAAIDALPGDEPQRHRALFAKEIVRAVNELNPELKPRFVRESMRIIGDHPEGREARDLLEYYDDLLREIELVLEIDGPTQVGHADAFGAHLAIWSTRQTAREAGSFSKYLRNEMWHPATGQPVDYRDDLEKHLRETLSETFDVVGVHFHDPAVSPTGVERPGWQSFPLAYILLEPKDARTDRIPQLRLDMDFSDGQGQVILPVTTSPVLIDAREELPSSRALASLEIEQVLDDRAAAEGKLRLEIHATARGVVPTLPELLDTSTIAEFETLSTEDHGLNIVGLDATGERVVALTERSWTVELAPPAGASLASLTFPTARLPDTTLSLKRYADADIAEAEPTVAIAPLQGPSRWWPLALAAAILLGAAALLAAWLRRRRLATTHVAAPVFTMPSEVTPLSTLAVLRRIQTANGDVLGAQAQSRLAETIDSLEQHYFAPVNGEGPASDPDLDRLLREWIAHATGATGQALL